MMILHRDFFRDESGQATTEYVLMVSIAVALAVIVIKEFLRPVLAKLTQTITQRLERGFFGNMHHFPVRR